MRLVILLVFFFYTLPSVGQSEFSDGVCNTYTLGDKEGYNSYNYIGYAKSSNGLIYTLDNQNKLCIIGNNFYHCADTITKLGGLNMYLLPLPDGRMALVGQTYMAVFNREKLVQVFPFAGEAYASFTIKSLKPVILFVNNNTVSFCFIENGRPGSPAKLPVRIEGSAILHFLQSHKGEVFIAASSPDKCLLYQFFPATGTAMLVNTIKSTTRLYPFAISNKDSLLLYSPYSHGIKYYKYANGLRLPLTGFPYTTGPGSETKMIRFSTFRKDWLSVADLGPDKWAAISYNTGLDVTTSFPVKVTDMVNNYFNVNENEKWVNTGNKPLKAFSFIKKYPGLFNKSNSASIFTVKQDKQGHIWAGSYHGGISVINNGRALQVPNPAKYLFMNGGSAIGANLYLIGENTGGLLKLNPDGIIKQVKPQTITGYYTHYSPKTARLYFGTPGKNGLWYTDTRLLEAGRPVWNKIDGSRGSQVDNIITITEDTLGRIWYGQGKRSLAVYYPKKDTATTWEVVKKETSFGALSSLVDSRGTIWIGSTLNGLWYYSDYSKPAHPASFKKINHPLLNDGKSITALTLYKNWLVIAAYDKVCLLNTDSLYLEGKEIVRYLNPQEAAFTSFTEQNTMLTSHTDSTVWFSTSDMLYQWNIKEWLQINRPVVQLFPIISAYNHTDSLRKNKAFYFDPGNNSFTVSLHYLSADQLPRYLSAVLTITGDSILYPAPGTESTLSFNNLKPGRYALHVKVFEMNGSISEHSYTIIIKAYLWQQWWFWAIISAIVIGTSVYFLTIRRKKQLAEQKAIAHEAELHSFKAEQEKKLADLRLISLSSQFRPHFILNALNTIGAQMDDKPNAETVLSRLGESVNLIFSHSRQQRILHPFENEWKLVKNVVHIHRLMYLKELEVFFPDEESISRINTLQVPLGILQIPVENALLHGLSNRESGPWQLTVSIKEGDRHIVFTVTDNGVGRKKSATLSNYTKHGTGTKNLNEVIEIINAANKEKISISYEDNIYTEGAGAYGTVAIITIPKHLDYEDR